jgi:iron(II)-dependent oxidoreductase
VGVFPSGASAWLAADKQFAHDLAGNVWEWCSTKWHNYKDHGRRDLEDPAGTDGRVLRGGSFYYGMGCVRCAYRGWEHPEVSGAGMGFRCAQ